MKRAIFALIVLATAVSASCQEPRSFQVRARPAANKPTEEQRATAAIVAMWRDALGDGEPLPVIIELKKIGTTDDILLPGGGALDDDPLAVFSPPNSKGACFWVRYKIRNKLEEKRLFVIDGDEIQSVTKRYKLKN